MTLFHRLPLGRRQFAAVLTGLAVVDPSWAADAAADQLLVGMSMNNLLSLDPGSATGLDALAVACNLYDHLLETDAADTTRLLPGLAEAWQVAEGGRALQFRLRAGPAFASG